MFFIYYEAARIYLARQFGIPFSETRFAAYGDEDLLWCDAIDYINFFIRKVGKDYGIREDDRLIKVVG